MEDTILKPLYSPPRTLRDKPTHYCAGCGHGIVHRILAEIIDELGIREKTIGIAPVGCAVIAYEYFNVDMMEAPHGRPPAVATGIKRSLPDRIVFTYQGDGDLLAIGIGELIHTASRGENITVVFINNSLYGMTGGQMAPTTLPGQKTATTPRGREMRGEGHPLDVISLIENFPGVSYLARGTLTSPSTVRRVKNYIRKAFQCQIEEKGFSLVEVLSPCPVNLRMDPSDALGWVKDNLEKIYPPGEYKVWK